MNYHLAEPSDFADNPNHIFLNLSPYEEPPHYRYYHLQGTGRHLHVAEGGDWRFEKLMTIGKDLQYVHESEVDFVDIDVTFNRARRRWIIGDLDTGEKAVHCRLPYGHGFLMKL